MWRHRTATAALLGMTVLTVGKAGFADVTYSFTPIDVPGAVFVDVKGINNAGQIVGSAFMVTLPVPVGYLDTGGIITTITAPGYAVVDAFAINDSGQILVSAIPNGSLTTATYVDTGGTLLQIPCCFGLPGSPNAINNSGQVAGSYDAPSPPQLTAGFVVNYAGGFVSSFYDPNEPYTFVTGLNNIGQVIGNTCCGDSAHAFVYDLGTGTFTTIDDPNGYETYVTGINDNGQIVGYYWDANGPHGFLDTGGVFTSIDDSSYLEGINDSGQIIGRTGSSGYFLATPVPVPEPRALPLFAACLIGVFAVRGRYRWGKRT